jgi:hypothetical protein
MDKNEKIDCEEDFVMIQKKNHNCFCSQFNKYSKTFGLCLEWKRKCNFCKYKNNKKNLIESLSFKNYYQYKQLFSLDELLLSKNTIKKIYTNDGKNIDINVLNIFFNKYNDLGFNQNIIYNLKTPLNEMTRNILKISIFNLRINYYNKSLYKENIEYILNIIDEEIQKDVIVINILIDCCIKLQLYENLSDLIEYTKLITIYDIYELRYIPTKILQKIMPKIINIFEIMSLEGKRYYYHQYNQKIDLYIDIKYLKESLEKIDFNDLQIWNNDIRVVYYDFKNGKPKDGIDASGLTKDFYSEFHEYLKTQLIVNDNYYVIPKFPEKLNLWKLYGILLARSIINQNISPQINIHPIISYFLISEFDNYKLKDLFEKLDIFNIEYIHNLRKIMKMNNSSFSDFLQLMDENKCNKKDYVKSQLLDKYFSNNFLFYSRI